MGHFLMKELIPRFQLETSDVLIQFETEAAMIHFIQHELPREVIEQKQYETRTLQ